MNQILQYFTYQHLPVELQRISRPICEVAAMMNSLLPDGPEKIVGLRKLLEAKDCFVRAEVAARNQRQSGEYRDD